MIYQTPKEYTPDYVADRLQLLDLCTRYAVGVDRKDWELFRSCFTEDAIIDYSTTGGPVLARDEMVEFLAEAMAPFVGSQHLVLNQEVEIDGDTAAGRIGFYNPMPMETGRGKLLYFVGGWYIDEYVRTPEGWKFSTRAEERSFDTSEFPLYKAYEAPFNEPG